MSQKQQSQNGGHNDLSVTIDNELIEEWNYIFKTIRDHYFEVRSNQIIGMLCDCCQINAFENDENIAWESAGSTWEMAYASVWQKIRGKHYCSGCYEIDEEDRLVVKAGVRIYLEHKATSSLKKSQ